MKQLFELAQITTSDGLTHEGLFAVPKRNANIGIVWVHGLTSAFSHNAGLMQTLAQTATDAGYAYAVFNNRGHDMVDSEKRKDGTRYFIGGGFEKFTDCVKDIDATIRFMRSRGCKKVILIGHSTGANKISYYLSRKPSAMVCGAVFAAGLTDVRPLDKKMRKLLAEATKVAEHNPSEILSYKKFDVFMNAQRYVSLFTPGGVEDTFPYHGYGGKWNILSRINVPVCVIIGDKDEHLSLPVHKYFTEIVGHLFSSPVVDAMEIKDASHSFKGKEKEFAKKITNWIKQI